MTESMAGSAEKDEGTATAEPQAAGGWACWKLSLSLLVLFLVIDHLTKLWAINYLMPEWWARLPMMSEAMWREVWSERTVIVIIPGLLQLEYAENTGAAFSMLSDRTFILGLISLGATVALFFFWRSLPAKEPWGRAAVALILSGAIGNMIDRFSRGYVVDFIHAFWRDYHWPIFNVADSAICVGAGILAVRFLKGKI